MTFDLAQAIGILERTPAVLRELLAGAPQDWIMSNEGPDSWSPRDVVGHLVSGEETDWMRRARIILAQGPTLKFEPLDRSGHLHLNKSRSMDRLLQRFAELRQRNLAELRSLQLTPQQLQLTGEHPEFGRVTLEQLLATWVVHDLDHLAQVSRVMAWQYQDAVGPWRAYLPVLHRGAGRPTKSA
jgi:hypothetical protein